MRRARVSTEETVTPFPVRIGPAAMARYETCGDSTLPQVIALVLSLLSAQCVGPESPADGAQTDHRLCWCGERGNAC
jgi:hypothetical protein